MDSALRKDIIKNFPDVPSDHALLSECASICNMYNITPTDLRYKLEAMNYKASNTRTEIMPITLETLTALKAQMQRDLAREATKKAQLKPRAAITANVDRSKLPGQLMSQFRATDVGMAGRLQTTPVKKEHEGGFLRTVPSHVVFQGVDSSLESKKRRAYRYMFEKITERSEALDQIIDEFAELIKDHYDISELADPSSSTDEDVTIVGRILQDPEVASTSKLSEGSLVIESSRMLSSGARVPVRIDPAVKIRGSVRGTGGYGLFPGQIVAFQGKNGGGGYFFATTILAIPPLKPSPTSHGIFNPKADPGLGESPSSVFIVSGPYTPDTDLLYKPWRTFLESLNSKKPHVLILIGPFVDSTHPKIKNGETETSPSAIFRARFLDPIKKFMAVSPGSIAIIIPSVRDVLNHHCVFPQCEFDSDLIDSTPNIFLQPNPARFSINDISFAVTSVDVLFHLRKEEYFKRGVEHQPIPASEGEVPSDSMSNLCRHLLNQRSFYPIFPVPQDLSHEVNLDVTHWDEARMVDDGDIDYAPDVLILPSRLKRFEKVVSNTLAINPSSLSKGSYAVLDIGSRSTPGGLRECLKAELVVQEQPVPVKPEAT